MSSERARRRAHPVPGRRLPAALLSARIAARSAPRGARTVDEQPRTGTIEQLAGCKRSLLITYRRDGTPVPTPVWAAVADGRLYVRSERSSGKVKRLANDARLLVAPCTVRGEPLGAPLRPRPGGIRARDGRAARGHVLPRDHAGRVAGGVLRRLRPARWPTAPSGASASARAGRRRRTRAERSRGTGRTPSRTGCGSRTRGRRPSASGSA